MSITLKNLSIHSWRQFERLEIAFHPRLTVITGANASGKTTILRILALHRWAFQLTATPVVGADGSVEFKVGRSDGKQVTPELDIGEIEYSTGQKAGIAAPDTNQAVYQLQITGQQQMKCFFIPSHRELFRYEVLQNIPTTKKNTQTAFDEVDSAVRSRSQGQQVPSNSFYMKSTLIGWAIRGYGVKSSVDKVIMPADAAQTDAYEGFQKIVKQLLPPSLGFRDFEIRGMEIVFVCNGGDDEFLLETASGGVATIVDLAWQIFMFSKANPGTFTVIIDEAENHLHPALQRTLLPNLLRAFPTAMFIVSTHSPLIVGSVRDSAVYALRYNDNKKVVSERLDLQEKALSASEVLNDILGVTSSLPVWVEDELAKILREISELGVDENSFFRLRERLASVGLERLFPEAMTTFGNQL